MIIRQHLSPKLTNHSRSLVVAMLLMFCCPGIIKAQDITEFREFEDTLARLSEIIYQSKSDTQKYEANEIFKTLFEDALSLNNSFKYPFDSLKLISILQSPDKKFRIMTWMILREDGAYDYFGYIQSFSRRKNDFEVYTLTDMSESIESPETKVLDHKNWYGAVYYDVIMTRSGSGRYYTLLGWDGNSPLIRRKIIEVVTLRSNGMPRFGHSLFRIGQPQQKRIFFEYSSLANMHLSFGKQQYYVKKKRLFYNEKRAAKRKRSNNTGFINRIRNIGTPAQINQMQRRDQGLYRYVKKSGDMIVFDNLIPLNPSLQGQRQFYVPEGNIMNGLHFSAGKWKLFEDIDARNPSHQFDNPKRRPKPEKFDSRRR